MPSPVRDDPSGLDSSEVRPPVNAAARSAGRDTPGVRRGAGPPARAQPGILAQSAPPAPGTSTSPDSQSLSLQDFRGTGRGGWLTGDELRTLVLRHQTRGAGDEDGVGPEAEALLGRALETSTWGARATHVAALCGFMKARKRALPLTERTLVAFVGYLHTCLASRPGPQLRGVSLPGYLSGVRSTHAALGLGVLPTESESLLLAAAVAGYRKAADATVPPTTVRLAIPVHVLYKVMCHAQKPGADRLLKRDAALLVTAVVFGLRPSGVEGLRPEHIVELSDTRCELLVSRLKGQTIEQALRRGARTFYAPAPVPGKPVTVLAVLQAWRDARSSRAARWFDHPS